MQPKHEFILYTLQQALPRIRQPWTVSTHTARGTIQAARAYRTSAEIFPRGHSAPIQACLQGSSVALELRVVKLNAEAPVFGVQDELSALAQQQIP